MNRFRSKQFLAAGVVALGVVFLSSSAQSYVFQEKVELTKGLAHYAMGFIYDLLGMTNRAILEYQKSTEYDDASYLTHLRLGTNYARVGLVTKAKQEMMFVQQYNPADLQSHYLLALIYSTEQKYDDAAKEFEQILSKASVDDPENIEIYNYLGQLYYSQRKYQEAIQQFQNILRLDSNNTDVMYVLGSMYWDVGERQKAQDTLKRALQINPDHDGCLNTLGYIYAEMSVHLDDALAMVEKAVKSDPKNAAYLDSLGWIYYKKGVYDRSLEYLTQAAGIMKDPVIFDHLGDVHQKLHNPSEASRYWEESLRLDPQQNSVKEKLLSIQKVEIHR